VAPTRQRMAAARAGKRRSGPHWAATAVGWHAGLRKLVAGINGLHAINGGWAAKAGYGPDHGKGKRDAKRGFSFI
jgi:hypothetical protein